MFSGSVFFPCIVSVFGKVERLMRWWKEKCGRCLVRPPLCDVCSSVLRGSCQTTRRCETLVPLWTSLWSNQTLVSLLKVSLSLHKVKVLICSSKGGMWASLCCSQTEADLLKLRRTIISVREWDDVQKSMMQNSLSSSCYRYTLISAVPPPVHAL